MNRRSFLKLAPIAPALLATHVIQAARTDNERRHHDVLARHLAHLRDDAPLAGDTNLPSHSEVHRALAHFALKGADR